MRDPRLLRSGDSALSADPIVCSFEGVIWDPLGNFRMHVSYRRAFELFVNRAGGLAGIEKTSRRPINGDFTLYFT